MKEKSSLQGIALAVLAALIWSGNFIVARAVHKDISPGHLSFFRWSTATVILAPFAIRRLIREWALVKKHFGYLFWLSLTGICLFNTFVYIGSHYTSAINLALIGTTSSPIFANVLARIFLKERISVTRFWGMLICVIGIVLLISRGNWENLVSFRFSEGDIWVLLAALSFAVYNIFVRKRPAEISPLNLLFSSFLLGTILLIPFIFFESQPAIAWNGQQIGMILYLGLGASIICFLIWNRAIQILGAGRTAIFGNLIPVFSTLEAVVILHEEFTVMHAISMAIVLIGLVIANLNLGRRGS